MTKVVITGASGLLGSHFLLEYAPKSKAVVALYRSESGKQLVEQLFMFYQKSEFWDRITWVKGDLNDVDLLTLIIQDADLVIHSAALVSFEKEDKETLYQVNVRGTENVLKAIKTAQVNQLVFISSVATIRNKSQEGYFVENGVVSGERSWTDYARSKMQAEQLVLKARNSSLDVVIINPGVILGPGNINASSTAIFKTVRDGLRFYTSGVNGVVDVRDVVDGTIKLLAIKDRQERYVCVGVNSTFKDLFGAIALAFGVKPPNIKAGPVMLSIACSFEGRLAKLLNRKPKVTRENTAAAFSIMQYDSSLLIADTGMKFRKMSDTVNHAVSFFNRLESKP